MSWKEAFFLLWHTGRLKTYFIENSQEMNRRLMPSNLARALRKQERVPSQFKHAGTREETKNVDFQGKLSQKTSEI